jgi:hypothetical protein
VTDIRRSVTDFRRSVTDFRQTVADIRNSVTDIRRSVTDIRRSEARSTVFRTGQWMKMGHGRRQMLKLGKRKPKIEPRTTRTTQTGLAAKERKGRKEFYHG